MRQWRHIACCNEIVMMQELTPAPADSYLMRVVTLWNRLSAAAVLRPHSIILASCKPGCKPGFRLA